MLNLWIYSFSIGALLFLTGIKSGSLFPSAKELADPPADGHFKTTINYSTFMAQLKDLCAKVLPSRSPELKIGCHSFRKTGYLVAIFGGGDPDDIKKSARHSKKSRASEAYRLTAANTYAQHLKNPHPSECVSKWQMVRTETPGNSGIISARGGNLQLDMGEVGNHFVFNILKILPNNPLVRDQLFLLQKAQEYLPRKSAMQELNEFAKEIVPESKQELFFKIVEHAVAERLANDPNTIPAPSTAIAAFISEPPPAKKARIDAEDLPERKSLKDLKSTKEKVELIKTIAARLPTIKSKLTPGAKSFVIKYLNPAIKCLENHFDSNVDRFCTTHPTFIHTTFSKTCCGQGATCTPKSSN